MSLHNAIAAFIAHGGDRTRILVPMWAQTYHVSEEAVRIEWERQMSKASLQPTNQYDSEGK